jgi:hypothetical protein
MKQLFYVVVGITLVGVAYGVLDNMLTYSQGAALATILALATVVKVVLARKSAASQGQRH